MKRIHRVLALLMAALMAIGLMTTAFAAEPTIDTSKKASLSTYKYDITKASEDGVWDAESYVSTGLHDDAVIDKLSKYAIQGVEFTYLKVADITMSNEVVDGQRQVGVLYGFDTSDRSNAVLSAIGLTAADAHKTEGGVNYFTSDALNNKLAAALAANATAVKNALEVAVKNGGVAMTETDATGHTSASNMEQGLYLVVETRVPENVTSTCNPFLISLPMTTVDGSEWIHNGIVPLWASEIEPFPIRVTMERLPGMLHYGDITKLNGALLPPVDIICGGSPCQDLSVAGKRTGLSGERSGLFMEQIRIIKEMRDADLLRGRSGLHVRPRFMCWENVPGAFSSNEGKDFQSVLEETLRIGLPGFYVPQSHPWGWQYSGAAILGALSSLCWRVLDAQYWGVPQSRKRIFLVADFGAPSSSQILFEPKSLSGHPP